MRNSIVEVILKARDEASRVASSVANNIKGSFGGIANELGLASLTPAGAALAAIGVTAGAGIAAFGAGVSIAEASTASLNESLGAANNWSSLTGDSFAKSQTIVADMTKSLGEQAAALPGTTQAYTKMGNAILDNVVGAYTALDGTINKSGATDWIKENVANLEILRQASGATEAQSAKDISRFIGGQYKTEKGLMVSDFFAMNPTLMTNLQKASKQLGYDTLEAMLKAGKKTDLIRALGLAGQKSVTSELKNALANTYDGAKESMLTQLFDPNQGIFGGLRQFNFNGQMTTLNAEMATVINRLTESATRIGTVFGGFLKSMGMSDDPLVWLSGFLDWVGDMGEAFAEIAENDAVASIGAGVRGFVNWLKSVDQMLGQTAGSATTAGQGDPITDTYTEWQRQMKSVGGGQMPSMGEITSGLGTAALGPLNQVRSQATAFVSYLKLDLARLGQSLRSIRLPAFTMPTLPPLNIGAMLGPIRAGLAGFVARGTAAAASFAAGIASVGGQIQAGFSAIISAALGAVGVLAGWAGTIAGIISSGLSSIGSSIASAVQSLISNAQSAAASIPVIGGLFGGGGGSGPVRGRANGQGVGQFQAAINRESRRMPAGARPVVANSSELIIPRSDLGRIASGLSSRTSTTSGQSVVYQNTFNISGNSPEAIGQAVLRAIESQQRRAARTALA